MAKQLIYAVDDEENIRDLYVCALENAGYACTTFENGDGLFQALAQKKPALILLDIMLDGMDGYAILERLKHHAAYREIPVIIVSAKGEELSKVKGLNLGADDYIAKPFGVLELSARIKANLRKAVPAPVAYLDLSVDENRHAVCLNGEPLSLSLKEYELAKLLILNAQTVLPREEILNAVWGENYFCESRTLDIHIASLRKELANSRAKIFTVRGVGYTLK